MAGKSSHDDPVYKPVMERGKKRKGRKADLESDTRLTRSGKAHVINLETPEKKGNNTSKVKVEASPRKKSHTIKREGNADDKKKLTPVTSELKARIRSMNVVRTRTSPNTLYDTIFVMNNAQKQAVTDIGLGSFLEMKITALPTKLGYYLVDKLDTTSMCIRLSNGIIPITVESIGEILGLPNRGIDLLEQDDATGTECVGALWKERLQRTSLRPKELSIMINNSKASGVNFKISFIVLFVNLMCECNTMGTCILSFLSKLRNESMLAEINWCKFMYDKVKTSKRTWRRDSLMCFYTGPLTYLTVSSGKYL